MIGRIAEWLAQWRPVEVLALVGILALALILLRALKSWRRIHEAEAEGEREKELFRFKQEMCERGLTPEQIEQLLQARPPDRKAKPAWTDEEALESLARNLTLVKAPAPVVEEVLTLVREADPETRRATARAVDEMVTCQLEAENPDEEQVLALVRGLCHPARPPRDRVPDTILDKIQV